MRPGCAVLMEFHYYHESAIVQATPPSSKAVVLGASITAIATIVTTLIGKWYVDGRLSRLGAIELQRLRVDADRELEYLRGHVSRALSEHNAELVYRFDAKRRAYSELQPHFFRLRYLCEDASSILVEMLRDEWSHGGERLEEAQFRLIAPQVEIRLIEEKLTDVDLEVDSRLARRYQVAVGLRRAWDAWFPDNSLSTELAIKCLRVQGASGDRLATLGEYAGMLRANVAGLKATLIPLHLKLERLDAREEARFLLTQYLLHRWLSVADSDRMPVVAADWATSLPESLKRTPFVGESMPSAVEALNQYFAG